MTHPNYRVRFYANVWDLTERDIEIKERLTKANLHDFDIPVSPNVTYTDGDWIWFEVFLPFVPSIGMGFNPKAKDFNWDEDTIPMVETIIYHEEERIFVAELSWGLNNHLEIARNVSDELRKQNRNKLRGEKYE